MNRLYRVYNVNQTYPSASLLIDKGFQLIQSRPMNRATDRLTLYKHQLDTTNQANQANQANSATMDRDPITCHVLNTLTGTPAANLPVMLCLLASPSTGNDNNSGSDRAALLTYHATTDADGRVKNWTSTANASISASASTSTTSVPDLLASLPAPDSSTTWSVRFDVGPWYAAQGVECLWPEVEVRFVVKGRGSRDGEESGWRHYHIPLLLGPWSYSTYRGS